MHKKINQILSKRCVILGLLFGILIVSTLFINNPVDNKTISTKTTINQDANSNVEDLKNQETYYYNYTTKEWLKNGDFTGGVAPWYNTTSGDKTDVKASYGNGAANYTLLGATYTCSDIKGIPQSSQWTAVTNPSLPVRPDSYTIQNTRGARVSHTWDENVNQTRNFPSIRWTRTITMPVNMSDYIITSASIQATFNATVVTTPQHNGIDTIYDTVEYKAQGDWVRFYVLIADINSVNQYQLAYNQSKDLGRDSPSKPTYPDTQMVVVPQDILINYLTSIFSSNPLQFIMYLGMDIYCEDNVGGVDEDRWSELLIRTCNLTFTYQKKINLLTSLSWNQVGNKLVGGEETQVTSANLKFKYKINETLSSSITPNSELRTIINGTQHSETVKLSSATTSWKDAKTSGFDVTSLIKKNVNISLSIQVYLAENFNLNKGYKISIDNVSLMISYSVRTSEIPSSLQLFLNKEDKTQSKYLKISKGETVNITVKYYNTSNGAFLDTDSVNLTGYGTPKALTKDIPRKQYNITIGTNLLAYGENYFKITAIKPLYQTQEISFTLDIVKRDTYLEVYVNNTNIESFTYYNCSIKEYLNITAFYRDSKTDAYITTGATLQLIEAGVGVPHNLTIHPIFSNQFNITYLSDNLEKGISFLQITGEKDNYTKASADFSVFVRERATNMKVLVNGTTPPTKLLIELEDKINITANFTDSVDHSYILKANVTILGGFYGNLTRIGNLYTITLLGLNLTQQGINFLTIYAYKENYQPQSVTFVVEVVERQTNLHIFFDGVNVTDDPSTAPLAIGKSITIMVNYFDKYNSVVGADVKVVYESTIYLLVEDPVTHKYSTTINTIGFGIGITIPYIIAERVNYQTKTENLRIQVRQINTLIITEDEEDTITIKPGEKVNFKIEVRNLDFGGKVSDCEVTYDWKYGDGELDEVEDGVYEFNLENVPEGTHKITITVYKSGGLYDFQEYEITLNVVREEGESLLYMIAFIVAVVAGVGLGSYFVAYYYVLKYPKPVRKIRKYRRTLKRSKTPKTEITNRDKAINELFKNSSPSMSSLMKAKPIEKIPPADKIIKKSIEKPTK